MKVRNASVVQLPDCIFMVCFFYIDPQQITALKKENFNLKLRIYFMEERMQQKCDDSTEDIFRTVLYLFQCYKTCITLNVLHLSDTTPCKASCDSVFPLNFEMRSQHEQQQLDFIQPASCIHDLGTAVLSFFNYCYGGSFV